MTATWRYLEGYDWETKKKQISQGEDECEYDCEETRKSFPPIWE